MINLFFVCKVRGIYKQGTIPKRNEKKWAFNHIGIEIGRISPYFCSHLLIKY